MNRYDYIGLFFSVIALGALFGHFAWIIADPSWRAFIPAAVAALCAMACRWCEPRSTMFR